MAMIKNSNIFLYTSNDLFHFFLDTQNKLNYLTKSTHPPLQLHSTDILEFDIDVDDNGNIGIVILDCEWKFFFYYYDGTSWNHHLLYDIDFKLEEIKHISINFSLNSPYILFCWRTLSSPNLWSIVSYYKENNHWEKEILNKIFLKGNIKPYILIRNIHYSLYLIYLKNNNMIYDLMIKNLPSKSYKWQNPKFLCNCISLKYFYLDGLFDPEGFIHISWIDKYKTNHCIKYISIDSKTNQQSDLSLILELNAPFIRHQFFHDKNSLICYGVTEDNVYYSTKNTRSLNWSKNQSMNVLPNSIYFMKIIQNIDPLLIEYHANYILSESTSDLVPISIQSIIKAESSNSLRKDSSKANNDCDPSIDSLKKLKFELFKKSKELEMKNNLINSFKGNISFLNEEIKRLNTQNKFYIENIHKNNEKYKKYNNNFGTLQKDYEKLLKDIETYQHESKKMNTELNKLNTENTLLKNEITKLKNSNFFSKFFN